METKCNKTVKIEYIDHEGVRHEVQDIIFCRGENEDSLRDMADCDNEAEVEKVKVVVMHGAVFLTAMKGAVVFKTNVISPIAYDVMRVVHTPEAESSKE